MAPNIPGVRRYITAKTRASANIRAILLDCNGVIIDDEPIHLRLFQKVLKEEGIRLTRKEYFKLYLAMDDRSCFEDAFKRHGRPLSPAMLKDLIERKAAYYKKTIGQEAEIFPGVKTFVKEHVKNCILAVVSGALRREIDWILRRAEIQRFISVIISAEDVKNGKPHPECYRKGLAALNRLPRFRELPLKAGECLAVEDSIHGVEAAKRAGMKVLAVTNSYSKRDLSHADLIVSTL